MTGEDLLYLAKVAALARLEFASPRLTLYTTEDRFFAQYAGAYASGCRSIDKPKGIRDLAVDIDSDRFRAFASTFKSDDVVQITKTATSLGFQSRTNNVQLRCYACSDKHQLPEKRKKLAIVDTTKFLEEIELAADLNSDNLGRSGPSGVNVTIQKSGMLRLLAFNGYSAMLIAQVQCEEITEPAGFTVPADDLKVGLQLFESGPIEISVTETNLILRNDSAWFRCSVSATAWPDLSGVKPNPDAFRVVFSPDQLKASANAAHLLKSQNFVEITGTENGVVMKTAASEHGQYATATEGTLGGSRWYGAEELLFASKLGKEITLEIDKTPGKPTLIRNEKRVLILNPKAM